MLIVAAVLVLRPHQPPEPPDQSDSAAAPLVEHTRSSSIDVPGKAPDAATYSFDATRGETIALFSETEVDLKTRPGGARTAFAKFSLDCRSDSGTGSEGVLGTENVHSHQARTFHLSMVYTPSKTGRQECSVTVDVPSYPTGHGTATLDLTSTIRSLSAPTPNATMNSQIDQEPIVIQPGEARTLLSPITPLPSTDEGVFAGQGIHLTTCTIVNGSQDRTPENLCTPDTINRGGSTVTLNSTLQEIRDGSICRRHDLVEESFSIDYDTHHAFASFGPSGEPMAMTCGTSARIATKIYNLGPAPLVVHRRSSVSVLAPAGEPG